MKMADGMSLLGLHGGFTPSDKQKIDLGFRVPEPEGGCRGLRRVSPPCVEGNKAKCAHELSEVLHVFRRVAGQRTGDTSNKRGCRP